MAERTKTLEEFDDEELFVLSASLRDKIAGGDETARPALAQVEAERLDRRADGYAPEHAEKAARAREAAKILRETGTITGPTSEVRV